MICKNIVKRTYQKRPYLYCRKDKKQITFEDCKKCPKFEPRLNKAIKKRSSKQAKIERDRDKKLIKKGICQLCGEYSYRLDPHEVFGGCNRKRSILNKFVILICRKCHEDNEKLQQLKEIYQKEYEKTHTREEFIKLIGKNYL